MLTITSEPKNPLQKPIHPAIVHFPIAFLSLAYFLDILNSVSPRLPSYITSNLPPPTDLSRGAYYLLSIGLLTAIPAVTTGVAEALKAINKQGLYEQDGKTIKQKFKATIAHAVANDVALAVAAYIWWSRRSQVNNTWAGKLGLGSVATPEAAYTPATWMVGVEAVIGILTFVAANIGGTLTYNFGIGMHIGGGGAKKAQ